MGHGYAACVLLMLRHDGRGWLGRVGSISDRSGLITTACVAMFCLFAGMIHEAATLSAMRGHRVDGMDAQGRYILRRMATDVATVSGW